MHARKCLVLSEVILMNPGGSMPVLLAKEKVQLIEATSTLFYQKLVEPADERAHFS